MEKIKKVLRPGGDKDDEVMYGTPSKVSDQPPKLESKSESDKQSPGILRQVLNPGGDKYSEQSYGNTATAVPQGESATASSVAPEQSGLAYADTENKPRDDSNLQRDIAVGGTAAGSTVQPHEGIHREDNGDDVSKATYTARSYALSSSSPSRSTEPLVDSTEDRRAPEEPSTTARDTSLAGAGTLIGAGAVGAGALAAQENKNNADDVEQATYTDRAFPVGGAQEGVTPISAQHEDIKQPENLDSANRLAPHVPGEFPTEDGQDPHVPGEFPSTPGEKEEYGVGSGAAVASAMGLTVGGAAAGGALASSKSDDASKATERDLHPGGSGFPHESSQTSDPSTGRDTAIGAGIAAAAGVGGGAAYAATRGDDEKDWPESPRDVGRDHAKNLTIREPGSPEKNPSRPPGATKTDDVTVPQQATKDDLAQKNEGDSNLGRNAAIAGGATAVAGAGAAGAYYATRDDKQEWQEPPRDVGREQAANLTTVKPGSTEKNPSKVTVPSQATKDDVAQAEEEDPSNSGRNAAIAGGAVAAGGGAAYLATRDNNEQKWQEPPRDVGREHAKSLSTKQGAPEVNPSRPPETTKTDEVAVPQQATKDDVTQRKEDEDESHLGRNTAIAGGAAAAAGGAAYYATRDDEPQQAQQVQQAQQAQQTEEKKGVVEKVKDKADEKKQEREQEKEMKKAEKEHEKAQKEHEKEEERKRKEAEKNMTKEERKEEERRKKEEWEKLNAERLAAYNRGELGPEDVLKDGQQPIADHEGEGPLTAEEAVAAGGAGAAAAAGGAAYAGTGQVEERTPTSSEKQRDSVDEHGEKKHGLMHKILHPIKSHKEEKERRASAEAHRSSQDSAPHTRHVGTDGPIGDDSKVSGLESSSSAKPSSSEVTQNTEDEIKPVGSHPVHQQAHMEVAEGHAPEGFITITHAGSNPDAPHLVVKEH